MKFLKSLCVFITLLVDFTPSFVWCLDGQQSGWCGNKHKNLVILRDIVQDMPGVAVPPFLGISTERVERFLEQYAPSLFSDYASACDVFSREISPTIWGRLMRYALPNAFYKIPLFYQIPLVGKFLHAMNNNRQGMVYVRRILHRIQNQIKACFTKHCFPFTAEEERFFARAAQQGTFFMVRSTGIEDSQTVANAGGNVSVSYVNPNAQEISNAMGEVVASYCGEQSMRNRLMSGESLELCLPVLIQELVGEQEGGAEQEDDIPVSGVAFTTRVSLSAPGFSVMEINAAPGHGEGIVANRVCADRYYLTDSGVRPGEIAIYPAIRKKRERLVHDGQKSAELIMHKNSSDVMMRSALSVHQLKHMYGVFKKIEQSYGQPMDIEFVVIRGKVLIVQARPAMHHDMNPSYCRYENIEPDQRTITTGNMLVLGAAQAIVIDDAGDVIIADTLDEADQCSNSATCKAVIVKEWASPLSHAAVNFTGRGIPCLCVQDIRAVQRMVNSVSSSQHVIIDSQRGVVVAAKMHRNMLKKYIISGWFEHPAERVLSIFSDVPVSTAAYVTPIPQDGKLVALLEQCKHSYDSSEQRNLFDQIVERISARCNVTEHRMKFLKVPHDTLQKNFVCFREALRNLIAELYGAFDRKADRFEILFYCKMLEALVYQQNERTNIVNNFTYTYFLNELFLRQHIYNIAALRGFSMGCAEELGYASWCPDRELAAQWTACVKEFMQLGKDEQHHQMNMKSLLADIHAMESLPIWFTTEFYRIVKSCSSQSPSDIADAVKSYFKREQEHAGLIQQLKRIKSFINTLKELCSRSYQTYAVAQSVWQQIDAEIIVLLSDGEVLRAIKDASSTTQLMACDLFVQIIDLIDTSMKTLKISTSISLNDRIELFKIMLKGFHSSCHAVMSVVWDNSPKLSAYTFHVERLLEEIITGLAMQ